MFMGMCISFLIYIQRGLRHCLSSVERQCESLRCGISNCSDSRAFFIWSIGGILDNLVWGVAKSIIVRCTMPNGYKKQRKPIWAIVFIALVILFLILIAKSCDKCYNSVKDPHFNCDGTLVVDSTNIDSFKITVPKRIKFYIEVSGSMNGFFRANKPTDFKTDVWQIVSYYSPLAASVTTLTNDGRVGQVIPLQQFQARMNTGAFVSTGSTKVPTMIQSIVEDLDVSNGEVAVLISDMIYSPVGSAAPDVLLSQYSTDISKVLGKFGNAICLIGATSNFLDNKGIVVHDASPYYYLLIGAPETVAELRNGISTLLDNNGHFVDNIESGFKYGTHPSYSFGIPDNCYQLEDNPAFAGYDPSSNDTCTLKLKINLEKYRWQTADENVFKSIFQCKTLYGSMVQVGDVKIETQNIVKSELTRKATAIVDLKLFNMPQDADVIEWSLVLPDLDITRFSPFLGATSENDRAKTYSLENFLKGMFYGGVVNDTLRPNYILVSKKS